MRLFTGRRCKYRSTNTCTARTIRKRLTIQDHFTRFGTRRTFRLFRRFLQAARMTNNARARKSKVLPLKRRHGRDVRHRRTMRTECKGARLNNGSALRLFKRMTIRILNFIRCVSGFTKLITVLIAGNARLFSGIADRFCF